jgi:hypothetical protein
MVVFPRAHAAGRRTTMSDTKTDAGTPSRQLRLYWSHAPTPRLDDATRDAVVRLLAQLLASASARCVDPEGRDETR